MPRIACLLVPAFPLAALLRAEPDLRGRPVATVDRDDPRAPLTALSPEAAALGARRGLSAAQARTLAGGLVLRRPGEAMLRSAEEALLDVADSFSPRVQSAPGVVFLELDGARSLFGTEAHLATSLGARLRKVGLDGRVGVASSKTAAWLAARRSEGVEVVPAGQERRHLAATKISLLGPEPDLAQTLERWGIRTLGELGELPATAIAWRFGEAGLRLWRRARGEDESPLVPHARPCRFEEAVDCGYAIDSLEPLSFLLRAALERLTARLDVRGVRAGDLSLSLGLEGGGREERIVAVAAPTVEVKSLLALVRLHLDGAPPRAAVESFRLAAEAQARRPIELDLFTPAGPSPQDLDLAIARLAAIAGNERVGRPVLADSHRPEAFALARMPNGDVKRAEERAAGHAPLALRAFRPATEIEVMCDRGRPDFVRASAFGGRVVHLAGPWRVSAEWWLESATVRDYYDAELTDGCVYRIYRAPQGWFVDGIYD